MSSVVPPRILSINISSGGIPKHAVDAVEVLTQGLRGDGHNHEKHYNPIQAVCLQDIERLEELTQEGYPVTCGTTGENVTVQHLDVNALPLGTILHCSGGVVLEITKVRKPCYVLDSIDPRLKDVIVGRCGQYAKVLKVGTLTAHETLTAQLPIPRPLSDDVGSST